MMEDVSNANHLVVNLAARTGAVKHGAAGFLYGLGNEGIPSANMLAPLQPQVAAQKPEGGLQHPNGDALDVAGTYRAAGGREIEIYLQDVYPNWPYDNLGIDDYLARVTLIVQQVAASPYRDLFSLVPFNEPDQIWYNAGEKRQALLDDWQTVYRHIKRINPGARIVGPNFAHYDSSFYRDFLAFAKDNNCLPDVISWHELNDDFFTGWYQRYEDYRAIERSLGLPAREICINEYCRITGDLGIPGNLIQWMARFENSKVDACLAYWTDAGSLNNLVSPDNYNQATGAWWLYHWYAAMAGETVQVTSPDANAEGLQGLASVDDHRQEVRIVFGGCAGSTTIVVAEPGAAGFLGNDAHVEVWAADFTGLKPSGGPRLINSADVAVSGQQFAIPIAETAATAAYQILVTPAARGSVPDLLDHVVTAEHNGFYNVALSLSVRGAQTLLVILNGAAVTELDVPADSEVTASANLFLTAGINRIAVKALPEDGSGEVSIVSIALMPGSGSVNSYEAESAENTLSGTATVLDDPAASGERYVGQIGNGGANSLQFNGVTVAESGLYRMVVHFANAEFRGGHKYNSQVADQHAHISVNGGARQKVYFRNTFAWDNYQTRVVDVFLEAGANAIKFSNDGAGTYAPHIDRIEIAAPVSEV